MSQTHGGRETADVVKQGVRPHQEMERWMDDTTRDNSDKQEANCGGG